MSLTALSWAFEQYIKPSAVKFVLIALSDSASSDGRVWPSIETLVRKTCQDRKTVISSIQILEEYGYLFDTGERKGNTGQVKVYRLNGLDIGETHYVYKVTRPGTGEFYIGVRSSWSEPDKDKYLGSGVWPIRMQCEKQLLTKEVLATFKTRLDANKYEAEMIASATRDPLCRNQHNSSESGTVPKAEQFRISQVTVPDTDGKSTENGIRTVINQNMNRKRGRKRAKTSLPEDFDVSPRVREWAEKKGYQHLDQHLESFRLKCAAKDYQYADWDSAFMNAIRDNWAEIGVGGIKPLNGKAYPRTDADWEKQGRQLGIQARPGESMPAYIGRLKSAMEAQHG